jgi:hypothetical protein
MTQTTAYLCESNEAASVGYYTEFGKKADKVSVPLKQQKASGSQQNVAEM